MEPKSEHFRVMARSAIKNPRLQEALGRATEHFNEGRRSAFAALPEKDILKARARRIKEKTAERLDEYLCHLEKMVMAAGGVVHWASDAAEACRILGNIAHQGRARLVIKSKSMATEEIGLNTHLESQGIEVVETDLGEFIVQLAGEPPSHIIAPAVHKTKEEVANLFCERLKAPYTDSIEGLAAIARARLREKFLKADMGISGANFAVAQTGTIALVTNEGNGRYVTSLPKIHAAIMGIEKVIPSLDDLTVLLRLLPRSATGQKLTSYTSLVTGPGSRKAGGRPEQFHLVLLDNGRSEMLRGEFREVLYCIKCGACLNVCPVYRAIGGHAYGWVYSGPVGSVLTPLFVGLDKTADLPRASTLCGACRKACPIDIDIPGMLLKLRGRTASEKVAPPIERLFSSAWGKMLSSRPAYEWGSAAARLLQLLVTGNGRYKRLPYPLSRWTAARDFPLLARKPFRKVWQEELSKLGLKKEQG